MEIEKKKILIEASGCHVHLTKEAVEALFGKDTVLKKRRDLSQPGEFLSEQRVKLVTKNGCVENVAVLGPVRNDVQVELSKTDCKKLGLTAPVNLSGNLEGATDVMIIGDQGEMKAAGSVIVARNHIHMRPEDAKAYGVGDGSLVKVEVSGSRKVIFEDVPVRVNEKFAPAMHIDFDEANACDYRIGTEAFILYENPEKSKGLSDMDMEQLISEVVKRVCASMAESEAVSSTQQAQCVMQKQECPSAVIDDKLITEESAKCIVQNIKEDTIRVKKGCIITPAAKDVFIYEHKKIEIV